MSTTLRRVSLAVAIALFAGANLQAQSGDSACRYDRCALGIIPRLSALDVVRGADEQRVGSLAFLWPRDVRSPFLGSAEAERHAARALGTRRIGALLTGIGGTVALTSAVRAANVGGNARRPWIGAAVLGSTMFAISVPVHFAADAELSRAVWAFNRDLERGGYAR